MSVPCPTVAGMASASPAGVQGTLDDLGTPLSECTFVVVDLETTGGMTPESAITEVGAVKVRGGEPRGEFATLVDPGTPIPPFITVLTGITDAMVISAPRIESVLPSFLEFARGCVLVAHNAPFDIGFLRRECQVRGYPWPRFPVVDTADLARRVLTRDEVPNCRLATLARFFRSATEPCHRALADARATVDVLHGLLERVGSFGVFSLEELRGFARSPTPEQQRKRHLADDIPSAPGVYMFEAPDGEVLYVGKSGDLRTRVRSYFTAAETRRRIREMIGIAERITPIVCATGLEAEVRELRLIAEHKPRYNRRSKFPERGVWLKLTLAEAFPRLSIVRDPRADRALYLGPFGSSRLAEAAMAALHAAVPLRQCTQRLTARLIAAGKARTCVLGEIGRCGAPCDGRESAGDYARHVRLAAAVLQRDVRPVVAASMVRIDRLTAELRYEEAATQRDRLAAFVRGAARSQRLAALAALAALVAARPAFDGGWELAVVRHGRLVAAGTVPPRAHPRPYVDALIATAETIVPEHPEHSRPATAGERASLAGRSAGPPVRRRGRARASGRAGGSGRAAPPTGAAGAEEMECILRWLDQPGVRLVEVTGDWSCPVHGAEGVRQWIEDAYARAGSPGDSAARAGRPQR
jgi:DNA polymerase-3 subunit epsilon